MTGTAALTSALSVFLPGRCRIRDRLTAYVAAAVAVVILVVMAVPYGGGPGESEDEERWTAGDRRAG